DLRLREQYFPGADKLVFDTDKGGYVPVSILMRKLIRHLTQPELRAYLYLQLRASKNGFCFPSNDEMLDELNLATKKNLEPHLQGLVSKKLISRMPSGKKQYFLVHDPRIAVEHLVATGEINEAELVEINVLLGDLKQKPIRMTAARAERTSEETQAPTVELKRTESAAGENFNRQKTALECAAPISALPPNNP